MFVVFESYASWSSLIMSSGSVLSWLLSNIPVRKCLWCVLTSTDGSFALVSSNASRYGIVVGVVNCCSVVPADRLFCCGTNLAM